MKSLTSRGDLVPRYRNFEFTVDQERGLDCREDLFNPLVFTFDLNARLRAAIVASTEVRRAEDGQYRLREIARRDAVVAAAIFGTMTAIGTGIRVHL